MKKYRLGDIVDIEIGRTPSRSVPEYFGGNEPWISIADLKNLEAGKYITESKEHLSELGVKESRIRKVEKGTVLYSFKLTIGKTAIAGRDLYTNEAIAALKIKDETTTFPEFLFYALSSLDYSRFTDHAVMGKTLNKRKLLELPINLPESIQSQRQIVAVLDSAKALMEKRQQSIEMLDELLRATFLEMFGDPLSNSKNWKTDKLKTLSKMERGRFSPRPRNDPSYFGGQHPFIQTGDISQSNHRLKRYSQTLNDKGIGVSKEFKKGDIVIAIVGATIGKTAILEIDTYATDSIIAIRGMENTLNNEFLEMVMRFYRPLILDKAPEAARANINLKILGELDIILPPFIEQKKFQKITKGVELIQTKHIESKDFLTNLFQSLLQQAFKGELALNVENYQIAVVNQAIGNMDRLVQVVSEEQAKPIKEAREAMYKVVAEGKGAIQSAIKASPVEINSVEDLEQFNNLASGASIGGIHQGGARFVDTTTPLNFDLNQFKGVTFFHIPEEENLQEPEDLIPPPPPPPVEGDPEDGDIRPGGDGGADYAEKFPFNELDTSFPLGEGGGEGDDGTIRPEEDNEERWDRALVLRTIMMMTKNGQISSNKLLTGIDSIRLNSYEEFKNGIFDLLKDGTIEQVIMDDEITKETVIGFRVIR